MNEIFFLCTAILFSSLAMGALIYALTKIVKSLRNWPMLWSLAIVSIFICSSLATVFFISPSLNPAESLNMSSLHPPLAPAEVLRWSTQQAQTSSETIRLDVTNLVATIYLLGVALFMLRLIVGRIKAYNIAANAKLTVSSKGIEYWVSDRNVSPYVIHFFGLNVNRFKIIIPSSLNEELDSVQIDHILNHELAHVTRRDDQIGLVLRCVLAFTWFSPVTHLLFKQWSRSIEVICDQLAIHGTPENARRDYADTLLKTLRVTTDTTNRFPVTAFTTNHMSDYKMRIHSILRGQLCRFSSLPINALMILSVSSVTLGGALLLSSNAHAKDCGDKSQQVRTHSGQVLLSGRLTASYGNSPHPFISGKQRNHKGIDIAAPSGTPIYAPDDGVVIAAADVYQNKPKYGKVVVIQAADKSQTLFSHLANYSVEVGQNVQAGIQIAEVGTTGTSTGPHVHIETFVAGERVDPSTILQLADL